MLNNIIGALSISIVGIYIWSKILSKKINFKSYKLYIGFIAMTALIIINFFSMNTIIRILGVVVIFALAIMYIYDVNIKDATVLALLTQLLYIISEVFIVVVVLIITNIQNKAELIEVFSGTVYANIMSSALAFFLSCFKIVKKLYNKVIFLIKEEKAKNIIIGIFTIVATTAILFNMIYFTNSLLLLSLIGLVLLMIYLIFIMKGIVMRNNYLNMYSKYNNTLETLKSYEDILDKYKVSNHENKNQLLMIRNMLKKDTKNDVSEYIDKIVENEYKDDENLMMETSKIPSGGLRALIYSKLLYMKNNKIKFDLKVDRKIRNVEFSDCEPSLILDICKIIGVFLDNAIEEVTNLKDGSISIELYILDKKLNISIANNFEGGIELDKIDEEKYTTKGEGHGYGLSLVKTIINKNDKLENIRMINDNVFIQILRLDI